MKYSAKLGKYLTIGIKSFAPIEAVADPGRRHSVVCLSVVCFTGTFARELYDGLTGGISLEDSSLVNKPPQRWQLGLFSNISLLIDSKGI